MDTATTTAFRIYATEYTVDGSLVVDTIEEARELATRFTKSLRMVTCGHTTRTGANRAGVHFNVGLIADLVNGGYNETGVKRYRAFRAQLAKLGYAVEWYTPCSNARTEAEFEAELGAQKTAAGAA